MKLTLALFPHRDEDYELLRREVTAAAVLDTGVTTSLVIDPHGKTLSYALLELMIEA